LGGACQTGAADGLNHKVAPNFHNGGRRWGFKVMVCFNPHSHLNERLGRKTERREKRTGTEWSPPPPKPASDCSETAVASRGTVGITGKGNTLEVLPRRRRRFVRGLGGSVLIG